MARNFERVFSEKARKFERVSSESEKRIEVDTELREVFALFDVNGDGAISAQEIIRILDRLKQKFDKADVERMIKQYDTDKDGEIDFTEFLSMMRGRFEQFDKEDYDAEMKRCFDVFDKNGDGAITPDEITVILEAVGETVTKEEIKLMMSQVDENSDGQIDLQEFKLMMADAPK